MSTIEGHPGQIQPKQISLTVKHQALQKIHEILLKAVVNNRPTPHNKALHDAADLALAR